MVTVVGHLISLAVIFVAGCISKMVECTMWIRVGLQLPPRNCLFPGYLRVGWWMHPSSKSIIFYYMCTSFGDAFIPALQGFDWSAGRPGRYNLEPRRGPPYFPPGSRAPVTRLSEFLEIPCFLSWSGECCGSPEPKGKSKLCQTTFFKELCK